MLQIDPEKLRSSGSCDSLDTMKHGGGAGVGDGAASGTGVNGKHPDHAFFEFTFRRFFDDGGHPMPSSKLTEPGGVGGGPATNTNGPVYV